MKKVLIIASFMFLLCVSCSMGNTPEIPETSTTNSVQTLGLTGSLLKDLSGTSARLVGIITVAPGSIITDNGICWNTAGNPDRSDSHTGIVALSGTTYTQTITGLTPLTQYYVRFYAVIDDEVVYGNILSFNSGRVIGSSYNSGIVFYNDGYGNGLLISDPLSASQVWSNVTTSYCGGTSSDWQAGKNNTLKINSQPGHTSSAAKVCLDFGAGTNTWHLPSVDMLEFAFNRLSLSGYCWTSTEDSASTAVEYSLIDGIRIQSKTKLNGVRAVRDFF